MKNRVKDLVKDIKLCADCAWYNGGDCVHYKNLSLEKGKPMLSCNISRSYTHWCDEEGKYHYDISGLKNERVIYYFADDLKIMCKGVTPSTAFDTRWRFAYWDEGLQVWGQLKAVNYSLILHIATLRIKYISSDDKIMDNYSDFSEPVYWDVDTQEWEYVVESL